MKCAASLLICALLTGCRDGLPHKPTSSNWESSTPIAEVFVALGRPSSVQADSSPALVDRGRDLVIRGRTASGRPLSAYFVCVDCHSTVRETPDGLLLPAPTLAGVADGERWFRGKQANLGDAVHHCAETLAQGRSLADHEADEILAYLDSLRWTLGDLDLTGAELSLLKSRALDPREHQALFGELRARFPEQRAQPAPFGGELLWRRACLSCHGPDGASSLHFGERPESYRDLVTTYHLDEAPTLRKLIREATRLAPGKQGVYMSAFPEDRFSDAMIEDLAA